jgi:hypothetical protein
LRVKDGCRWLRACPQLGAATCTSDHGCVSRHPQVSTAENSDRRFSTTGNHVAASATRHPNARRTELH